MAEPHNNKYKPEYCKMLIDHMALGMSFESFASKVGVCIRTIYYWRESHEEFDVAYSEGHSAALSFVEKRLMAKIAGQQIGDFNPKNSDITAIIFWLKTRGHKIYGDKSKQEVSVEPITLKYNVDDSE